MKVVLVWHGILMYDLLKLSIYRHEKYLLIELFSLFI